MTRIAAVIVTYNRADRLRWTLDRTFAESFDQVFVVNNASTDATTKVLAQFDNPRLTVMNLPENVGGAGGFAAGINAAENADWLVLFDDDAWPAGGAINRLRAELETVLPDVAVLAADVRLPDGSASDMNRPIINPFWNLRNRELNALRHGRRGFTVAADTARDIDAATFVGYGLRGSVARKMPKPEAGLFLYSDDILYSLALRKAGWRIRTLPQMQFIHDCETLAAGDVYRPLWKNHYTIRNGVEVARVAAGWMCPAALAYLLLVWTKRGLRLGGRERRAYFAIFARAFWHGLRRKRGRFDPLHLAQSRSSD